MKHHHNRPVECKLTHYRTVQLVDGEPPNRRISVLIEGELRWIHERDVLEIDPWPAIHGKVEEAGVYLISEGDESPKILEIREWFLANFDEDTDQWMR